MERGIGITNLVNRATARADELSPQSSGRAVPGWRPVALHHPVVVAIAGVTAYRAAFVRPEATAGEQPDVLAGARVWVVPIPAGSTLTRRSAAWRRRTPSPRESLE